MRKPVVAAGGVRAAVVRREELVQVPAIDLVLDAVVREVHLAIEIREVVLVRPVSNLVLLRPGRPSLSARSRLLLQERLVLRLQVLFEDDAADLRAVALVSQPGLLLPKRGIEIRLVVDLP